MVVDCAAAKPARRNISAPAGALCALLLLAAPTRAQSFDDYFHPVDTIALSTDALIGDIGSIDVDADSRMLIKDQQQSAVHLFAADGSLIRTLSVEACNPGFEMHPIKAVFNGDEIFMSNSGAWGYRFNRDGTCKGPVDSEYRPSEATAAVPAPDDEIEGGYRAGSIFELRTLPTGYWIQEFDHTGRLIAEFEQDDYLTRYIDRFGLKFIMVDDEHVYLSLPNRPTVRRYTRDGSYVDETGFVPDGFREIRSDIQVPEGDVAAMMREVPRQIAPYSSVHSAGLLNADTFLVQYSSRALGSREGGVLVFAYGLDGEERIPPLAFDRMVYHTATGRVYVVSDEKVTTAELTNPSIVVYQWNDE